MKALMSMARGTAGVVVLACLLVACGGGGGGSTGGNSGGTNPPVVLAAMIDSFGRTLTEAEFGTNSADAAGADGTAADGETIANAAVTLIDNAGHKVTGTTDAQGYYRVRIDGFAAPIIASVAKADGTIWYSPSVSAVRVRGFVTINLSGLTDKLTYDVANAAGLLGSDQLTPAQLLANQAALATARTSLASLLSSHISSAGLSTATFDPVTAAFRPDGTGYDQLLKTVTVSKGAGTGPTAVFPKWAVGGSIAGLGNQSGLVLANNGESLIIAANATSFTFPTLVDSSSSYLVSITSQPTGAYCTLTAASGQGSATSATAVGVACNSNTYAVGGTITGLGTSAGLELQMGSQSMTIAANSASFAFPTGLMQGSSYAVTVKTQPTGRTCGISGGQGTIATAPVTSVAVTCSTLTYALGGSVSGLGASGLVLASGGETLSVPSLSTAFNFLGKLPSGAAYNVTVQTQPTGFSCTVANGSGTVGSAAVGTVAVNCTTVTIATVSNFVGSGVAGMVNGTGAAASFNAPMGMVFDRAGNLYIADANNNVIRKVTPAGVVSTFAGSGVGGTANGAAGVARFSSPRALAIDAAGNIYVADYGSHLIRKVTVAGDVSTLAGSVQGHVDGTGSAAAFNRPYGLAVDANGNIFVSDQANARIRKISPVGVVTTVAGTEGGAIYGPQGIAVTASGTVIVADAFGHAIKSVSPAGVVTTLLDLMSVTPALRTPWDIVLDSAGNIYFTDRGNYLLRRLSPTSVVTAIAGTGVSGLTNGPADVATLKDPAGLVMDGAGNFFVSETNTAVIRKIAR